MKHSDYEIYNHYIRLYDNLIYVSITAIADREQQFQKMQQYACLTVERWKDCFKLCDDYPLLRLETYQIALYKATYLPLISIARDENELRAHLLNYFKEIDKLVEKADKKFKYLEDKTDDEIEWLDSADDFDTFMKGFQSEYSADSTMYLSAEKRYAAEEINDWYSEIKEDLTDSEAKEEYGARKAKNLLRRAKQIKDTYISLVNRACSESDFELAVFDFTTYSAELEYQLECDNDDDEDDEEDEKEERREERREKAAEVAGVVAAGAGVAAKTTGKIIWKIILFPFWLIWQLLKFLFGTKGGRILLVFIILAAAGVTVWLTKAYVPVVNWVTGLFSPNEEDDFVFEKNFNGTYTVIEYKGSENSIVIPSAYDGKQVTKIGDNFLLGNHDIEKIVIPDSITEIGEFAFHDTGLTSVILGNNITKIGDYSLSYCRSLTNIVIPVSINVIGKEAFLGSGLKNVYYIGNAEEWQNITIREDAFFSLSASLYYYSETQPSTSGNYWHYKENGEIEVWS